jgi:hypothetical protein
MKRAMAVAAVGILVVGGMVIAVLKYDDTVHGTRWAALAIFFIGFGAVGALALGIAHAYALEAKEARPRAGIRDSDQRHTH